ncbi:MAG: sulfatase [Verrucomicrobiaceae bacterium]|nr:sulfatase [Verrucomicrobiaceae bacterium]
MRRLLRLFLLVPLAVVAPARSGETRPPNILFAIADDWGAHAGAYGTPWVKTPGFDRVAREGVLFTRAYTPVAKCAPSRAIVLTGRHAWQLEEAGNHMAVFPPKFKSWPEVLREAGWHVGITGKGWGPGRALDAAGQARQIAGIPYNKRKLLPLTTGISKNDYAANFVDFLDAAPADAPWCFWYGSTEPHRGYEFQSGVRKGGKALSDIDHVPDYWPDHETVRHDMLDYALEVEHTDRHLVAMLAELERRGALDETIIIVTSDHGMPFPRVKGYAYHDANHIPLAIRWPAGTTTPGRVVEDFVDFTDIAPTLLDLAGIDEADSGMAAITGKSWRGLLESDHSGRIEEWRDHVLVGKERTDIGRPYDWGYPIRGILRDDFLYLRNYEPDRWPAGNPETGYLDTDASPTKTHILKAGRRDRSDKYWRLNFGMRPAVELYDLRADPDGAVNIARAADQGERIARLEAEMTARLEEQGDPRMFGKGYLFDEYPIHTDKTRNFYERFLKGELDKSAAGWVHPDDFEPGPLPIPPAELR